MTQDEIVRFVEDDLGGTIVVVASEANGAPEISWGDTFFIYDPDGVIPPERQFPYATIVNNDVPGFDEASNLARDGVFRVNMWVSRPTFEEEAQKDPDIDYTAVDRVIPTRSTAPSRGSACSTCRLHQRHGEASAHRSPRTSTRSVRQEAQVVRARVVVCMPVRCAS